MQIHGYPYSDSGSTFIVEMHEDVWRRAGFDGTEDDDVPARRLRRATPWSGSREIFAEELAGHRILDQQLQVAQLPHRAQRALVRRQRRAGRRRRAHRALLDRLGHQARDGGRARPGRLPARAARRRGGARRRTRPSASPSSSRRSAPRRPRWSGSRTSACTPTRTPPSSSSTCSPGRAASPSRTSRTATPSSRRGWRPSSPRHQGADERRAGDVPADPDRRAGAEEPDRRLARWTCTPPTTACPTTSTSSTSAPRRSAAPDW